MSGVSLYLNFSDQCEAAFNFYKTVFQSDFSGGGIARFGDFPPAEDQPPLSEKDKNLIMHIELPILGGHRLMGSDAPESLGFKTTFGNNVYINLEPGTREETHRLFNALSEGGKITQPLGLMFWGALYGTCFDKFGVQWMFNCTEEVE